MTRGRLAALLGAVLLAATGCTGGTASPTPTTSDAPSSVETGPETGPGSDIDYVALGDSFSAGPFIGTMRTDPNGCARSKDNYPAFLAAWLGVATYTDVTCSAALTRDLAGSQRMLDGNTTRPQLDAVTPDTDLVTLGIGGNDFDIYTGLIGCQDGKPCDVTKLRTDARKVAGRIEAAVTAIRGKAPDATVYVVGYPDILPSEGTCGAVGVPADVLGPVADVAHQLNASLRRGATAAGASYVDMEAVSKGHDVCAKGRAWVNGPRFRAGVAAPFHPKINGMRGVASELYREITGEEPDVTEYADPAPSSIVLNEG